MARFEINDAALHRFAREAVESAVMKVDRDMAKYRGKPIDVVKSALERAMRRHGLTPNAHSQDFLRVAEVIASGGHLG